ncbi:DUF4345 domain-containing protein [Corallococcus terminator]
MPATQRIVQVCLFLVAAIALFGGSVQLLMGQPETTPRLDNLHRFMGGIYFSMGVISLWAAITIRQQRTLVYLIAFSILMAAVGRLLSMSKVGLPEPTGLWLGYLIPELVFPVVIAGAHWTHARKGRDSAHELTGEAPAPLAVPGSTAGP